MIDGGLWTEIESGLYNRIDCTYSESAYYPLIDYYLEAGLDKAAAGVRRAIKYRLRRPVRNEFPSGNFFSWYTNIRNWASEMHIDCRSWLSVNNNVSCSFQADNFKTLAEAWEAFAGYDLND
jgi:hypothetical protein